jgi:hypothetical protein
MALKRILEPEVMDTERDAVEYDGMDFTDVNLSFALRAAGLAPLTGTVLDVGTGTARIPILFLQQSGSALSVHAVDLSAEMLKLAAVPTAKCSRLRTAGSTWSCRTVLSTTFPNPGCFSAKSHASSGPGVQYSSGISGGRSPHANWRDWYSSMRVTRIRTSRSSSGIHCMLR